MLQASKPVRLLVILGAAALFVLAAGSALAVADDYRMRDILPQGASVAGIDASGLSREAAIALVEAKVAQPLTEPVTVTHGASTFTLDAGTMVSVDTEGMVNAAFAPKAKASLPERVVARLLSTPTGADAEVALTLDEARIDGWLDDVASQVDTMAVDATMTVQAGKLVVNTARKGEIVDREATAKALVQALTKGDKKVELAVRYTEPTVTDEDLGKAILVDLSERRLYLYNGPVVEKEYGVAVGAPGFSTPRGSWRIVEKRYLPTWGNPGSDWAKDMPATIPPGPNNPLGTRAMNLNAPGIRIHGTNKDSSIGTAASHGCMRMHRWDVEDLYERVDVGTPVFIVS